MPNILLDDDSSLSSIF